jgi:hypothetical protein
MNLFSGTEIPANTEILGEPCSNWCRCLDDPWGFVYGKGSDTPGLTTGKIGCAVYRIIMSFF